MGKRKLTPDEINKRRINRRISNINELTRSASDTQINKAGYSLKLKKLINGYKKDFDISEQIIDYLKDSSWEQTANLKPLEIYSILRDILELKKLLNDDYKRHMGDKLSTINYYINRNTFLLEGLYIINKLETLSFIDKKETKREMISGIYNVIYRKLLIASYDSESNSTLEDTAELLETTIEYLQTEYINAYIASRPTEALPELQMMQKMFCNKQEKLFSKSGNYSTFQTLIAEKIAVAEEKLEQETLKQEKKNSQENPVINNLEQQFQTAKKYKIDSIEKMASIIKPNVASGVVEKQDAARVLENIERALLFLSTQVKELQQLYRKYNKVFTLPAEANLTKTIDKYCLGNKAYWQELYNSNDTEQRQQAITQLTELKQQLSNPSYAKFFLNKCNDFTDSIERKIKRLKKPSNSNGFVESPIQPSKVPSSLTNKIEKDSLKEQANNNNIEKINGLNGTNDSTALSTSPNNK